jgi:hypothetical protein
MLSLALAKQLKKAGLSWTPRNLDVFVVPDRGLDDTPFVLTDVMAYIELFRGSPMVTFHGTAEWALDYVLQSEAVWLPSEAQLHGLLRDHGAAFTLRTMPAGYRCEMSRGAEQIAFDAADAADAYGSALLHLLWSLDAQPGAN